MHERLEGTHCLVKVLCDLAAGEKIIGLHVVGDHAAEVMQGFALALRLGATKADLDATIGIHPRCEYRRASCAALSRGPAVCALCLRSLPCLLTE